MLLIFYTLKNFDKEIKEIFPGYISKNNLNWEIQTDLMVPNEEKETWHCLAAKQLFALHGITSKHKGNFYRLNSLHPFKTKNKLKFHEKVCKNI